MIYTWLVEVSICVKHVTLRGQTVKGQGDEFQRHIAQANIQSCSSTTRANASKVERACHERFLIIRILVVRGSPVGRVGDGVVSRFEAWKEVEDEAGESKLYEHVHASREEGKVKVEMLGIKHPLVVLPSVSENRQLNHNEPTIDIESEKRYHSPINKTFTRLCLMTLRDASLLWLSVTSSPAATR